jgi:hypothetical protein
MLVGKTNKNKGNFGLGKSISYFTENEYVVSIPLNDTQKYDLVVEMNGELKRIQVKTTTSKDGVNYQVDLRTTGGNRSRYINEKFDKSKIDYLFIYTENGSWLIPSEEIKSERSINLGEKFIDFKID